MNDDLCAGTIVPGTVPLEARKGACRHGGSRSVATWGAGMGDEGTPVVRRRGTAALRGAGAAVNPMGRYRHAAIPLRTGFQPKTKLP